MVHSNTTEHHVLYGLGTDIIEIARIEKALEKHQERFLERIFTQKERDYCQRHQNPLPHYAGRFAAKEAIVKALGTGITQDVFWQDIEILNDASGKPEASFSKRLQKQFPYQIMLSISHCNHYATATAILVSPQSSLQG